MDKGRGYLAIGGSGLLLAAGYLWLAFKLPFGQLDRPGAAVFPVAVGCIFAFASLAAMWEGWHMDRAERVDVPTGVPLLRIAGMIGGLLAYIVLLPWLGQLLASFIFCVALMYVLSGMPGSPDRISSTRILLAGAIIAASVYGIFIYLIKVPMPLGILAP